MWLRDSFVHAYQEGESQEDVVCGLSDPDYPLFNIIRLSSFREQMNTVNDECSSSCFNLLFLTLS